MPTRQYVIRKRVVVGPKEVKTIHEEAFLDDYFVIEEIYIVWKVGTTIFLYLDGALWDLFKWEEPVLAPEFYYLFSRTFTTPIIVLNDIRIDVKNDTDEPKSVEIIIDGYLAPKEEYKVKVL